MSCAHRLPSRVEVLGGGGGGGIGETGGRIDMIPDGRNRPGVFLLVIAELIGVV